MITLETLEKWLNAPAETECLEFKEAKQQFDTTKLLNQQKSVLTQIEMSNSQSLKPLQNQQKSVLTQIELLELDKSGIDVAEYITVLSLK
jgi:hypothetical protein